MAEKMMNIPDLCKLQAEAVIRAAQDRFAFVNYLPVKELEKYKADIFRILTDTAKTYLQKQPDIKWV